MDYESALQMETAEHSKLFIIHLQFNNIFAGDGVLVKRFLKGNASADIGTNFLLSFCWKNDNTLYIGMSQQVILYSRMWIHFGIWSLALKVLK